MKKNLLIDLPEDVFINHILLSKVLPMKSLLTLKCVCKCLRNLITSPAFIKLQLHTNQVLYNNNQLVLLSTTFRYGTLFGSLKVDDSDSCRPEEVNTFLSSVSIEGRRPLKLWGCCNGLLCLAEEENVCLWNPFTKEYKDLPPPLPLISTKVSEDFGGSITYGFGYDSLIDDYKIIRCRSDFSVGRRTFDDNGDKHVPIITEFQVYTLGTNTWRMISSDNNPYKSYYVLSLKSVVFVNGALHWFMVKSSSNWLMGRSSSKKTETKILSFDIEKEVFQEIQIPLRSYKLGGIPYPDPEIQVLRECLCLLELDHDTKSCYCNVWLMMDYGTKGSWTKLLKIDSFCNIPLTHCRMLRFCENGTKILMRSFHYLFVYDPINNKASRVDIGDFGCPSEIYIESLVSLNSGVYKGVSLNSGDKGALLKLKRKRKRNLKQALEHRAFGYIHHDR